MVDKTCWVVVSLTYTLEAFLKVSALLGVTNLCKYKFPMNTGVHPELFEAPLEIGATPPSLSACEYIKVDGSNWKVSYLLFHYLLKWVFYLSTWGHIKKLLKVFGYLQNTTVRFKIIVVSP